MNQRLLMAAIVIFTFGILGIGVWVFSRPVGGEIEVSGGARAEVDQSIHDWGEISFGGGKVEHVFLIKNTGGAPLQLANVKTSCMCTTAQIDVDGRESPVFGMHGRSRWVDEVAPGGEAKLKVIFDPAYHGPSGIGPITRQVVVATGDAGNPELEFTLNGVVIQ